MLSPSCTMGRLCDTGPCSRSSVSSLRIGTVGGEIGNILRADVDCGLGEGPQAPPAVDVWPPTRYRDQGGYV